MGGAQQLHAMGPQNSLLYAAYARQEMTLIEQEYYRRYADKTCRSTGNARVKDRTSGQRVPYGGQGADKDNNSPFVFFVYFVVCILWVMIDTNDKGPVSHTGPRWVIWALQGSNL
jgi:hypothetical protein